MTDESAQVVVIGGGAIGLSIACHLGRLGVSEVLLLERDRLTSGTSWHAAGIVGPLRASMNLTRLAKYALELFVELEIDTGQATGYRQTGGVWLAQRPARLQELRRIKAMGDRCGLDTEMLTAAEISQRLPLLCADDLVGGLWVDQDGQVNPVDLCMAYARAARSAGVEIREHSQVVDIDVTDGAVRAVMLADGSRIACGKLVICAGAWSRQLAAHAGIELPIAACEHMYVVTDVIDGLPDPCPIIRDLDSGIYLKGDSGKLVLGAFEANPKPWAPSPHDAGFLMFDEDWEHAQPMLEAGIRRAPVIAGQGITHFMNGPESFSVDTRQVMGESLQCANLFVAAGFNSIGIMSSAGVGKVMAEWVNAGAAPMDLWEVDIARLDPLLSGDACLAQRIPEAVHNQFAMHWPFKQYQSARDLRRSPWHDILAGRAAVFGAPTGWERPLWYAADETEARFEYSYGRQCWWPAAAREAKHCQNAVSLFELSPFAKFEISGPDALNFLQGLCCNDIDIAVGRLRYSLMLNPRGGIEAEITVTRLEDESFRIVSGAATRFKDACWLRRHLDPALQVKIDDVTEDYAVIGVMGPGSRSLMQELCGAHFGDDAFPFSSVRPVHINACELLAARLSFVGELGWELYIPVAHAQVVLERVLRVGAAHDLGLAGHFALDACRIEVGFRHWGHDMGADDTPFEVGLGFAVELDKPGDFIGRDALCVQQRDGWSKQLRLCEVRSRISHRFPTAGAAKRTLACRTPDDPPQRPGDALATENDEICGLADSVLILHDEPVYVDAEIVGHCTSGGRGFRSGKSLCFVLFYREQQDRAKLKIEIAGERFDLSILEQPPYRAQCR